MDILKLVNRIFFFVNKVYLFVIFYLAFECNQLFHYQCFVGFPCQIFQGAMFHTSPFFVHTWKYISSSFCKHFIYISLHNFSLQLFKISVGKINTWVRVSFNKYQVSRPSEFFFSCSLNLWFWKGQLTLASEIMIHLPFYPILAVSWRIFD